MTEDKGIIEGMRLLWNNLDKKQRRYLAELIAMNHPDFLCSFMRNKEKCKLKGGVKNV
jgi:hypothetical protein